MNRVVIRVALFVQVLLSDLCDLLHGLLDQCPDPQDNVGGHDVHGAVSTSGRMLYDLTQNSWYYFTDAAVPSKNDYGLYQTLRFFIVLPLLLFIWKQ